MGYNKMRMATVCPPGFRPNPKYRGKRGQRQCLKERTSRDSKIELQRVAKANDVSIYKRRKDGMGFTKTPLSMKALRSRLTRMKVSHNFGMATVCPPGYSPNPKYEHKRGQRQCLKNKMSKATLKELQRLAKDNEVSIYKRRKDDLGFTKTPLSIKSLKARLTRMKVKY